MSEPHSVTLTLTASQWKELIAELDALADEHDALKARLAEAEKDAALDREIAQRNRDAVHELTERLAEALEVLLQCKEKLDTYRNAWGPEYLGGVEYSVLVGRIKRVTDSSDACPHRYDPTTCSYAGCVMTRQCQRDEINRPRPGADVTVDAARK